MRKLWVLGSAAALLVGASTAAFGQGVPAGTPQGLTTAQAKANAKAAEALVKAQAAAAKADAKRQAAAAKAEAKSQAAAAKAAAKAAKAAAKAGRPSTGG